jgi:hypothetical protein
VRRLTVFIIAAVVTGLLVGVVIAGGGDDNSGSKPPPAPALNPLPGSIDSPSGSDTTKREKDKGSTGATGTGGATTAPAEPSQPTAPSGGSQAPPEDTPQNDTQPPAGSPAQKFEDFCSQNPAAC